MLLVPLPSRSRVHTTTPANPLDGQSGYCAPPASRQLAGNQHGNTKEERREGGANHRKTSPTPLLWELEHDAHDLEKVSGKGWVTRRTALACWHSGLRAVTQVRVCSSQTRNLSLSFSELLVATHGVQTLQRPGWLLAEPSRTSGVVAHSSSWTPAACEQEVRNLSARKCNFGTFSSSSFGKRKTSFL